MKPLIPTRSRPEPPRSPQPTPRGANTAPQPAARPRHARFDDIFD